jgi:cell division protein FtsW
MTNHQYFERNSIGFIQKWWIDIDKINFLILLSIIAFGFVAIISSSPAIAKKIDVEKFFFIKKQLAFVAMSLILLVLISFFSEENIKIFAIFGMIFVIVLLFLVLFAGAEIKGAKRWISIAGLVIQPSEFAKTFFVVFNAYILQKFQSEKSYKKYIFSSSLYLSISLFLILQPDFGMTLTLTLLWAAQLFIYGIPMFLIYTIGCLGVFGVVFAYITLPHVEDRINKFLANDGKNYQVERSLDGFVNGSFFGTGPGNGVVKKFIPDAHTDFIFAVIGEEYGIISCVAIVLIFAYLITRITKRAIDEENMFVYLSLVGLMMQFAMQVIINIGVSLRLFPTKGMTLPFISYGGSSMISMAICFGMILSLTKKKYHKDVDYGNVKAFL